MTGSSKQAQPDQEQTLSRLQQAESRAERAEREVESLRKTVQALDTRTGGQNRGHDLQPNQRVDAVAQGDGIRGLRKDSMMAYLLDSLDAGQDIGHYGRLVFAMVARHFLPEQEVVARLTRDRDFSEDAAVALLRQVEGRDYNPPRRERILEWQREQEFPILPHPEDPDCGNVYRSLKFPEDVYEHIQEYQGEKAAS
jgi:hypothetical protein